MEFNNLEIETSWMMDTSIIFKINKSKNNVQNFPNLSPTEIEISLNNQKIKLKILNTYIKPNEIIIRLKAENIGLPKILHTSIKFISTINNNNPIPTNIPISTINPIPTNIKKTIRNPYIYTNVESGYSARSFPSVYIQRYKYGPQPGKPQTTPMVSPIV